VAYQDLREFIARLDAEGELIRVRAPVDPELEITEITDRVSKGPAERNKALLFENVRGSDIPVLINMFGSRRRMALALGVDDLDELGQRLASLLDLGMPKTWGRSWASWGNCWMSPASARARCAVPPARRLWRPKTPRWPGCPS